MRGSYAVTSYFLSLLALLGVPSTHNMTVNHVDGFVYRIFKEKR
jgi:hypothetical protein